jgi:hypothetical protein
MGIVVIVVAAAVAAAAILVTMQFGNRAVVVPQVVAPAAAPAPITFWRTKVEDFAPTTASIPSWRINVEDFGTQAFAAPHTAATSAALPGLNVGDFGALRPVTSAQIAQSAGRVAVPAHLNREILADDLSKVAALAASPIGRDYDPLKGGAWATVSTSTAVPAHLPGRDMLDSDSLPIPYGSGASAKPAKVYSRLALRK